MFQFNQLGKGAKKPDASDALPNEFGKVRTFKEDLDNFEKGKSPISIPETEVPFDHEPEKKPLPGNLPTKPESAKSVPPAHIVENIPSNPFQSVPTSPPISSPEAEPAALKSSSSQSFFSEKPSPQEHILPEQTNKEPTSQKNKKKFAFLPIVIILIVIFGAGAYYYWFYMRSSSPETSSTSSPPPSQTTPAAQQPASDTSATDSQNKNLRQLVIDTTQSPTEIKNTIQKFATDYSFSSSNGDIAEIKIIGKDNQAIGKKDFLAGFGITIPDAVLMKLSEDFSLFITQTNGNTRLGFVFKTITASGLSEEMANWEPTITTDLSSLYLAPNTALGGISFSSSQYKNADIRYFNFSSPADTSLDYSVVSNFLIIGTSKASARAILDYMAGK